MWLIIVIPYVTTATEEIVEPGHHKACEETATTLVIVGARDMPILNYCQLPSGRIQILVPSSAIQRMKTKQHDTVIPPFS